MYILFVYVKQSLSVWVRHERHWYSLDVLRCLFCIDTDPDYRRSLKHGVLTLKNVELSDTAVYQCKAANKHGSILINAYVYVIGKLIFESSSKKAGFFFVVIAKAAFREYNIIDLCVFLFL